MKFDLELAVKHPDRIRHRNSNQYRIQKVVPVPDMGVVLMQDQCSNTRLHRYTDLDLYLYLTGELVPWEPAEVPLDHWFRLKGVETSCLIVQTHSDGVVRILWQERQLDGFTGRFWYHCLRRTAGKCLTKFG